MFMRLMAAVVGLAFAIPMSALAAMVHNSTGISNPQNVITFEEIVLTQNTEVINQYSALGVTFGSGLFYDGRQPNTGDGRINMSGHALANFDFDTCPCTTPFSIHFVPPVDAAAFAMAQQGGNSLFEALLNGTVIESFSAFTDLNSTNNYFGFQGITFDQIRVTHLGSVSTNLDNIQFNPTTVEPSSLVDHFLCYDAKISKGEPKFENRNVVLSDQFETANKIVKKPKLVCNPVDKNGEGIINSEVHLTCYEVKKLKGDPKFEKRLVSITNQFGDHQVLEAKKPKLLCVPSNKVDLGLVGPEEDDD